MSQSNPFHACVLGYGRMGQGIVQQLLREGVTCSVVDPYLTETRLLNNVIFAQELNDSVLKNVHVVIDFTTASAVRENLTKSLSAHIPYVLGTTGWNADKENFLSLVESHSGTVVTTTNFSLPVQLFFQSLERIAPLFALFPEFDVSGFERHHREKIDSPSGTALSIAEILLHAFPQKKELEIERSPGKISQSALHFPSLRAGFFPGTHEVIFDSPSETFSMELTSRNREGFISGAIWAARWVSGFGDEHSQQTPKSGWYDFRDVLRSFVEEKLQAI